MNKLRMRKRYTVNAMDAAKNMRCLFVKIVVRIFAKIAMVMPKMLANNSYVNVVEIHCK